MSQPHAKPAKELTKKHGDPLESALHPNDTPETTHTGTVPPPDDGGHAHSAAAHLDLGGAEQTKPKGNLRHGSDPGALRQPPMVVQRVGKQHRD